MKTVKTTKAFDCLKMKRDIQAKIYAEIKHLTAEKVLAYFNAARPTLTLRKRVGASLATGV